MKSMLPSILVALCIALPFLACSLPQDSLNSSQQVPQQKRINQDVNVSLRKIEMIMDVQFSPDGTLLAIATDVGILLYGTKTYDNPEILKGHTGKIWSIAFRPDGKVLASAGLDKIRLWDVNTRQQIKTFEIKVFPKSNIAFSPDGKMLASGGMSDGIENAWLWDAGTGKCLRTFSEHTVSERKLVMSDVAFSPDGKVLASTNGEQLPRLWDVNTGQLIRTLTEQIRILGHWMGSVAFSPDGNMLVSGSRDSVGLWDVNTGKQIRSLTLNAHLQQQITSLVGKGWVGKGWRATQGEDVAFSPDGNTIACAGFFGIHLWDTDSGQYHRMLYKEKDPKIVRDIAFSPDGNTIACSGYREATVWDVKTEKLIRVLISKPGY